MHPAGASDKGIVRELPGASPLKICQKTGTSPTRIDTNHPRRCGRSLRHLHQSEGKAPGRFPAWVSGPIVRSRRTNCGGSLRFSAECLNPGRCSAETNSSRDGRPASISVRPQLPPWPWAFAVVSQLEGSPNVPLQAVRPSRRVRHCQTYKAKERHTQRRSEQAGSENAGCVTTNGTPSLRGRHDSSLGRQLAECHVVGSQIGSQRHRHPRYPRDEEAPAAVAAAGASPRRAGRI